MLVQSKQDPGDDFDPRTRPWFTKAVSERKQVWTDPYLFFTSKTPGITVASPVFNEEGGVTGVVGVDIDLSALSDFLGYLELSEHSSALILNNNGDVIAYRQAEGEVSLLPVPPVVCCGLVSWATRLQKRQWHPSTGRRGGMY